MFHNPEFIEFGKYYAPYLILTVTLIVAVIAGLISNRIIATDHFEEAVINGFSLGVHVVYFACSAVLFVLSIHPVRELFGVFLPSIEQAFFTFYAGTIVVTFVFCTTTTLINIYNRYTPVAQHIFTFIGGVVVYPILFTAMLFIRLYLV